MYKISDLPSIIKNAPFAEVCAWHLNLGDLGDHLPMFKDSGIETDMTGKFVHLFMKFRDKSGNYIAALHGSAVDEDGNMAPMGKRGHTLQATLIEPRRSDIICRRGKHTETDPLLTYNIMDYAQERDIRRTAAQLQRINEGGIGYEVPSKVICDTLPKLIMQAPTKNVFESIAKVGLAMAAGSKTAVCYVGNRNGPYAIKRVAANSAFIFRTGAEFLRLPIVRDKAWGGLTAPGIETPVKSTLTRYRVFVPRSAIKPIRTPKMPKQRAQAADARLTA